MRRKCPSTSAPEAAAYLEYVHFALCDEPINKSNSDDVLGLNWALTPGATRFLADGPPSFTSGEPTATAAGTETKDNPSKPPRPAGPTAMQSCGNEAEMHKLITWFGKPWHQPEVIGQGGI